MKKFTVSIIALALLAACGQPGLREKKDQLADKEKALANLQDEISDLKTEIAKMDSTEEIADLTPVEAKTLQVQNFEHFVKLTGTITSSENVLLSAESMGRVVSIPTREGAQVRKGDVLVQLNNDALQQQLGEAQAAFNLAETTFERRKRLWQDSIGSEIEYLNSKTQFESAKMRLGQIRAQLNNAIIKAPVNGKVDEIQVNEGEFVSVGMPVVRVVDMSNLEVEAEISENYLRNIGVGDSVIVNVPALSLQQKQPITFASQYINPNNRSFKIKVGLDNSSRTMRPNLLAELNIRDYRNTDALVVPAIAIKRDLKGEYLFVLESSGGENRVTKRYVQKGKSFDDQTEIIGGLKPGERIVIAGFNEVSDGEVVAVN